MNRHNSFKLKLAQVLFFTATLLSVAATAQERAVAGYEKGFFIGSPDGDYELKINGRLQTRAQFEYINKKHNTTIYVPAARLQFGGHAFDPRYGFGTQFAYDRGGFKLIEFFANIGLSDVGHLKVGHFLGNYSLLEENSTAKLEFMERSVIYGHWKIDTVNGVAFYNDKKNTFSWEVGVYENGESPISKRRRGVASASIAYNYNQLDHGNEPDFDGGPLRFMVHLGGFTRSNIQDWKFIGYAATLGAMAKINKFSINSGFFGGVPEAPLSADAAGKPVQDITTDHFSLGAFGQGGYMFDKRYGVAARYSLGNTHWKGPLNHEILASASAYFFSHNFKIQVEGGANIVSSDVGPVARAQIQLAF